MVSTHLQNISQIGSFPQIGVKIKNIWNHHLAIVVKLLKVFSIKEKQRFRVQPRKNQAKEEVYKYSQIFGPVAAQGVFNFSMAGLFITYKNG